MAGNFWKQQADGTLLVNLDASVYSGSACLRAAHELSANLLIKVEKDSASILLSVAPLAEKNDNRLGEVEVGRILRAVTDYTLREQLNAETAHMRNAILAAAFRNARLPFHERADGQ